MKNNAEFIEIFEKELAEFTGAEDCVVVDSCSNALFLAMYSMKDKNFRKEQEIPQRTYLSVPFAMERAGFKPRLIEKSWQGYYQIGDLPIVDSAPSLWKSMYKNIVDDWKIKTNAPLICISFHSKKVLPIGKGGAILLKDKELAKRLRRLAFDGRDYTKPMFNDQVTEMGFHMNMSPHEAARGLLLLNEKRNGLINISPTNHFNYRDLTTIEYFKSELES